MKTKALTLLEWLIVIAIVALLLAAMAIPAFTRLKNHAPQTAEQPLPAERFTATMQKTPMDLTLWLVKDNATGSEFLFFRAGYGVAAVPLATVTTNVIRHD